MNSVHEKPQVLLIGALPPPFIGPSVANVRLSQSSILNEAFDLRFFDISDRRDPGNIGRFDFGNVTLGLQHLIAYCWKLLTERPRLIYLGVSQGFWGYVRDLGFIIPALLLRRRVVIHLRGSEFHTFYQTLGGVSRWITKWVFGSASSVIVLGERLKYIFKDLVSPERIAVVPNGIDCSAYNPPSNSGTKVFKKRILFLSSLRKRKGLMLFLNALPTILEKHPDASVMFAGTWQSEEDKKEATGLVQRFQLENKCTFVGEISGTQKIQAFLDNDLFVFPPVEPEGLPWVILEAMSASLPIVTTDQGAIAEVVADGKTGYVIEPTPSALADRVNCLLSNPSAAVQMGVEGRQRVEERFSERACHEALKSIFVNALSDTKPICVASQEPSENVIALR